jgi:hypothetical protein
MLMLGMMRYLQMRRLVLDVHDVLAYPHPCRSVHCPVICSSHAARRQGF